MDGSIDGIVELEHAELLRHLGRSTGLPATLLSKLISEMLAYFQESVDEFVQRRHRELRGRGVRNAQIWPLLLSEIEQRRFATQLSERQLRRLVYG